MIGFVNKFIKKHYLLAVFFFLFKDLKAQQEQILWNNDPAEVFINPPESAKPGVLWMWMGSNLSKTGITKDLEALKKAGFNRTTMFSLADVTTPWAGEIGNSPTPEIVSWTEPWWEMVRHAAQESKRLGMDFGMYNGAGYESSGGTWITPELSMQEICWSKQNVKGNQHVQINLEQPKVNPRANQRFPLFNPKTGLVEKPIIPERATFYKDITVIAAPAEIDVLDKSSILDISDKMLSNGKLDWEAPKGNWIIYRFGHTTMGKLIQPAQSEATGFECDKMSEKAVSYHMDHLINEIQKHIGDLIGTGFSHLHFDSYEAGTPTWTLKMQQEFLNRRGYDLKPYLLIFAGRNVGGKTDSLKFRNDFDATIKDLYRDVYFATIKSKLNQAKLDFLCEPYGGPWRQDDVLPLIDKVMTEFWTNNGLYRPYELDETVAALRKSGQNIVEAEAFTGAPNDSKWNETPFWLKPIGDAAFCAGVNRLILHRFVQQPWDNSFLPGASMGQWGTHFDRTQTWWSTMTTLVDYWKRCQALLQWGNIAGNHEIDDFNVSQIQGEIEIKSIHRNSGNVNVYFVANTSRKQGSANCSFKVTDMQPELWDPVKKTIRNLNKFTVFEGKTIIPLIFDEAQSFFIVFRNKTVKKSITDLDNFPFAKEVMTLNTPWEVSFDSKGGGPANPVVFQTLKDWTKNPDPGIKYYSGTAVYSTSFNLPKTIKFSNKSILSLNLGVVKHVAEVSLNGKYLGTIWTAPWNINIPINLLKKTDNELEVKITNVWANRLIGDEQQPDDCEWLLGHQGGKFLKEFPEWFLKNEPRPSKNRFCFTTWNYFTKNSPLVSSGLLGPVRIMQEK